MDPPPTDRRSAVYAALARAVWAYRGRTLAALALLILAKLSGVVVPLVFKAIIDRFSDRAALASPMPPLAAPGGRLGALLLVLPVFLLLGYALLRFLGTLFTELRDLAFARVTRRAVGDFSGRIFAHLLALSPRFHSQRDTGALIRDVERGTAGVGFLLGAGLFTLLPALVELVAVLGIMAAGYDFAFSLVIVLTFAVYAGYTTVMTQRRELHQRRVNAIDSRANGRMVDALLNYETVRTHAREDFERTRYAAVLDQWVDGSVENQKALSTLHVGQSAIIAVGVALVMLLAGEQTARGTMTVGDLVLVNSYVIQICLPLNTLGFVFREANDALVNAETLFALLDVQPEIAERRDSAPRKLRGGALSFEHVDLSYEPGRQVLWDVSLEVPAGRTVAVVGGSGSGKSTLARLLLRMYEASSGRIAVDGQDLRGLTLASLREAIGVVPQDTVLFNDTIAFNIGYGRPGAGLAEIVEAAKAAQVHEFVASLPAQYDTVVGERGVKLSGGEKQRIAIARAFLKNPPIMILDEATSALDTRAERAIQGELDRIAQGRTTLVIAHRLSTIVNADQIVVMDKGRIVERGRHEELLRREGLYAQLWNLQLQQQRFERLERALARQPVDLRELVAQAVDGLREAIEARGVALGVDVEPALAHVGAQVSADAATLAQTVRELLLWAALGTPPGGTVQVRLERHRGAARLSVADGRHALTGVPPRAWGAQGANGTDGTNGTNGAQDEGRTPLDPLALRSTVERQGGAFSVEPPASTHGMRSVVELPLLPGSGPLRPAQAA
jgi:ATP-binding cassette subfamily B protein